MEQDTTSARGMAAAPQTGDQPVSLAGAWAPDPEKIGICCSGGGIRSASFNLGALQALQDKEVLGKADYLASVSGGGYTAAAMTMIAGSAGRVFTPGTPRPFAPGSPEELYLRNRSSYLAPGMTGKLRLVANLLRGLLLNVLVLGAALVVAGAALGWITRVLATADEDLVAAARNAPLWLLGLIALALVYRGMTRPRSVPQEDKELTALRVTWRAALALLVVGVAGPLAVEAAIDLGAKGGPLADAVAWAYDLVGDKPEEQRAVGTLAQLGAVLAAVGVPALVAGAARTVFRNAGGVLGRIAIWLIVPLLSATVLLIVAVGHRHQTSPSEWYVLGVAGAFLVSALRLADVNAGSMHRFYKRRLCTAFALERVWRTASGLHRGPKPEAEPTLDAIERDYDVRVELSKARHGEVGDGTRWPRLVMCAAANVGEETVTPPGRNAVTFTFDPDWIGGPEVTYARTADYERLLGDVRGEDVTIPAAMAISGAALAPCMGVMTKPYLRTLLTLVNARLGVWLPSPSWIGRHAEKGTRPPRPTFSLLLREANGRNKHRDKVLYVTDGGHWENLGLVELLRRGCGTVYCVDASGDKEDTFFTIGQAISMARSELGVEIALRPDDMRKPDPKDGRYCVADHVVGSFTFTRVPGSDQPVEGRIVFVKAQVTRAAPWDVRAYKEKDAAFPNHSLLEQMFADQTFEAYRALGYHAASGAVDSMRAAAEAAEAEAAAEEAAATTAAAGAAAGDAVPTPAPPGDDRAAANGVAARA